MSRSQKLALVCAREALADAGYLDGDYLSQPHTRRWFRKELYAPSEVIDRSSVDEWERNGANTAFERASDRVEALVNSYEPMLFRMRCMRNCLISRLMQQ
jgi:trimethylamine:corrinoid methyltransferase-like protein